MNANTNTSPEFYIPIYVDGELTNEIVEPVVTPLDVLRDAASVMCSRVALQVEMGAYDVLHGTNYREIRNSLVREKRNAAFEAKIGLIATKNSPSP